MAGLPPPLPKLSPNVSFARYDDHSEPHRVTTLPQLTLFVVWLAAMLLWLMERVSKAAMLTRLWSVGPSAVGPVETDDDVLTKLLVSVRVNGTLSTNSARTMDIQPSDDKLASDASNDHRQTVTTSSEVTTTTTTRENFSTIIAPPSFDEFLQQIIILGVVMIYFYLCDYKKVPLFVDVSQDGFLKFYCHYVIMRTQTFDGGYITTLI